MNNSSLEKLCMNISNSWVVSCSILTFGMMHYTYLNCINDKLFIHNKRKNILELQHIDKLTDLGEKISVASINCAISRPAI